MKRDWFSYGAVLLLSMIWGSSFFLTTIALEAFHPFGIAGGRILLSMLAVATAVFFLKDRLPTGLAEWRWCAGLGLFSLLIPFTALAWGQQSVPSATASIFVSGGPIFILALSRIFLGERVTLRRWIGFTIGLSGMFWLIGVDAFYQIGASGQMLGQLACLGASLSYAVSAIIIRMMPPIPILTATIGAQLVATFLILPLAIPTLPANWPPLAPIAALAVLGLIQTGLAQLLRFHTVRRSGPVFASLVGYLIPIWAGAIGVLFLSETLTIRMMTALTLILAGLWIARDRATKS